MKPYKTLLNPARYLGHRILAMLLAAHGPEPEDWPAEPGLKKAPGLVA